MTYEIETWDPDTHLPFISRWLGDRGLTDNPGDARLYPSTGFVVDQCAVGFLYRTDAPLVGYIDGFITDPAAPARRRYLAIECLTKALVDESVALGIKLLFANTNVKGLVGVGAKSGFQVYGTGFQCLFRVAEGVS